MYKINIVAVGTLKEKFFKLSQDEYLKRLSRFCEIKIIEIPESRLSPNPTQNEINSSLDKEMFLLSPHLKGKIILLAIEGEMLDSVAFSNKLFDSFSSFDTVTFVIGSSYGLSEKLKSQNYKISFSKMTFPHHLMRIFLEEQIYRAFTIKNNISYHK